MTTTCIELSEDAFAALFRPFANHLNPHASFDWGAGYGTLFETYGEELDYVRSQDPARIWTLQSGDGDFICSGYHLVNRVGYFITEHPVPAGVDVEIPLEVLDDRELPLLDLPPPLPSSVLDSIRKIVDYHWHDEETHFLSERDVETQGPDQPHIFEPLSVVRRWLDTYHNI